MSTYAMPQHTVEDELAGPDQPTVEFPCVSGVGSVVEAQDAETGFRLVYELVERHDADPNAGLLSVESPVGRALLGRCVGEVATASAPRGHRRLRILSVRPA